MKFAHYQNICARMHAHMHMLFTSHTCRMRTLFFRTVKTILKILIMSHAYACSHIGSYWFNYRIARYEALKPQLLARSHKLAHTCTLYRAPINTQPDPSAVG